jgi:hypothetical protein
MILEEIIGDVVCTIIRETGNQAELTIGDYFSDHERSSLTVMGTGKIIVRVDPNCTIELCGVEPEIAVETEEVTPVVQEVGLTDTVSVTEETPVIINPKAAKAAE